MKALIDIQEARGNTTRWMKFYSQDKQIMEKARQKFGLRANYPDGFTLEGLLYSAGVHMGGHSSIGIWHGLPPPRSVDGFNNFLFYSFLEPATIPSFFSCNEEDLGIIIGGTRCQLSRSYDNKTCRRVLYGLVEETFKKLFDTCLSIHFAIESKILI